MVDDSLRAGVRGGIRRDEAELGVCLKVVGVDGGVGGGVRILEVWGRGEGGNITP